MQVEIHALLCQHGHDACACHDGASIPGPVVASLTYLLDAVLRPLEAAAGGLMVTSGYRTERTNRAVGGAAGSQHVRGEAADVKPVTVSLAELWRALLASGLPVDQAILEPSWVHVSATTRHAPRGELLVKTPEGYRRWEQT